VADFISLTIDNKAVLFDKKEVKKVVRQAGIILKKPALNGVQADIGNFTHRIVIRYRPDIHLFKEVIRQRERIDGTINIEIFRIHSVTEWEGQQIWLVLDVELLTGTN
jgi:hypothetical protein